MKYYAVAGIDILDSGWVDEYIENVTRMVEQRGGRYLARTPRIEKLEGQRPVPQIFLIIEWPSKEAALSFYESDEYGPFRERRIHGTRSEFLLITGEDIAGVASIGS